MKAKCLRRGKYWGGNEKKVKVYLWMNALLELKLLNPKKPRFVGSLNPLQA